MARGIPPVRTWQVTYHLPHGAKCHVYVDTINKRFARWIARDKAITILGAKGFLSVEKVTAYPLKPRKG